MLRSIPRFMLPVFGLLFLLPAKIPAEEPKAAADAARLLMQVIDTVVEHHIEAPTRQQMVLNVLRHIAAQEKTVPSPGLSQRISAADPADLETLLAHELSAYLEDADAAENFPRRAISFAEFVVPGHLQIQTREENRVEEQIAGNRYVGIGVAAGMHQPTKQLKFVNVIAGGPAAKAGVKNGDIVETVDGKPTQGKTLEEVIHLLRGEEGTDVTIAVRQPNEEQPREYTITRNVVPFNTVEQPAVSYDKKVAAVGFQRLSASTVHELQKIEESLPDTVEVVTFDFRNLSGDNLHHGILIANALIDGKPIGQVETTGGVKKLTAEPGALFGERKLIALLNNNTGGTALWLSTVIEEAAAGGVAFGQSAREGFVSEGIPIADGKLVLQLPTARLRRIDGSPLASREPRTDDSFQGVTRVRPPGLLGRLIQRDKLGNIKIEPILQQGNLKTIADTIASWYRQQAPILNEPKE